MISFTQTNSSLERECRISSGIGIANAAKNSVSIGHNVWLQLSYKLASKVSVATEYENMVYRQPSFYNNAPSKYDEMKLYDNNFSILFKYHLLEGNKVKIMAASGWTHCVRQQEFYEPEFASNGVSWVRRVSSFGDYRIPLLAEIEYPVMKTINVQARVKYNLVANNGSSYSAGIGVSLRL